MDYKYEEYAKAFEQIFNPDYEASCIDIATNFGNDSKRNTSIANYVWLPFRFDGEMAYLDWTDEWRIEDYE